MHRMVKLFGLALLMLSSLSHGHSLDAMFISITEQEGQLYRVVVTPSSKGRIENTPRLNFPAQCVNQSSIQHFYSFQCDESILGHEIGIDYAHKAMNVMLVISYQPLNGTIQWLEVEHQNHFVLEPTSSSNQAEFSFWVGVQHMLSGAEHLMLVVLIVLLFSNYSGLFRVVTLFTCAHLLAMLLGQSLLGWVSGNGAAFAIYLAIVLLAYQALTQKQAGLATYPLLFVLGLLHGLAMYAAIFELHGQYQGESSPLDLLYFNLGVEAAQLSVIVFMLVLAAIAKRFQFAKSELLRIRKYSLRAFAAAGIYWTLSLTIQQGATLLSSVS